LAKAPLDREKVPYKRGKSHWTPGAPAEKTTITLSSLYPFGCWNDERKSKNSPLPCVLNPLCKLAMRLFSGAGI
jgi:hypothetical protein